MHKLPKLQMPTNHPRQMYESFLEVQSVARLRVVAPMPRLPRKVLKS